jgi:hypothetical protein
MRAAPLVLVLLLAASSVVLVAPAANALIECDGLTMEGCPGLLCVAQTGQPLPCNVLYVSYPCDRVEDPACPGVVCIQVQRTDPCNLL